MPIQCLHDRQQIAAFCRRDIALHLYTIGDLDDFFWPYTTWYALVEDDQVQELVLVYSGAEVPTVLGLTADPVRMTTLLRSITNLLPHHFYAHLSADLAPVLAPTFQQRSFGEHFKMMLTAPERLDGWDTSDITALDGTDLPVIQALFDASYPGNWFDPRMLETGYYYGAWREGALVSIAGIHVYSAQYRVAALGNITTHPHWRGQGLATHVSARLCQSLRATADHIGLNVTASNTGAIAAYRKLGFEPAASYWEYEMDTKL